MSAQLPPIELLDCDGDPVSLGLRWEKWKRSLEIYLFAANIVDPLKKRATLLHMGGTTFQEIFFNIPGANVEAVGLPETTDVYTTAITKLDEFFAPKQSKVYERHLFRLLKQEQKESFDKFLVRLREQCRKCKFPNEDENLVDQITEKCNSVELKKKILTMGDTATLDKIISEATALETVHRQLTDFKGLSQMQSNVNRIEPKRNTNSNFSCTRCGNNKHNSNSPSCPARNKTCLKCGFLGHYSAHCRTRINKRKLPDTDSKNTHTPAKKPKRENTHSQRSQNSRETLEKSKTENSTKKSSAAAINYIFYLDEDTTIQCNVGGVVTEMLIDSGSSSNIISDKTWARLKNDGIQVTNQIANPEKIFMAYGSNTPLTVLGSFEAEIMIGPEKRNDTFYVIEDGTRDLLGKSTAVALKVLQLGLNINTEISR